MNAFLTLASQIVAFGDSTPNTSPTLRFVDWKRTQQNVPVNDPGSKLLTLAPQSTTQIFNGARSTSLDGTTEFTLAASSLGSGRYRLTHTAGTDPVLRTARVMATSGIALTMTANDCGTLTVEAGSGTPFANVVVGDVIFVPGVTTGDSDVGFSQSNQGEWIVLGRSDTVLTLVRDGDFIGASEVVTPASNAVLAYSAAGVQVGDKVSVSAGFAASAHGTYEILAVTSSWFEIVSVSPLAAEVAVPGVAGMAFYETSQRFLRVESDRDCVVRLNGDTGNSNYVAPLISGGVGSFEKTGETWSLVIVNKSVLPAKVSIITAE